MQHEALISESDAVAFLTSIHTGASAIYEAYSDLETKTREFSSEEDLTRFIVAERRRGKTYFTLAIHYEGTDGGARTRTIDLVPEKCNGATWRETTEGWGLIFVQLTYQEDDRVKCNVSANSQKRAAAWAITMQDRLGSPESWNWPMVEKNTRRLVRKLRGYGSSNS